MKLLIVEDDTSISRVLEYYLTSQLKIRPIFVSTVPEAIAALDNNDVNAILLDYYLEGNTAQDILEHLDTHHKKRPAIILFTASPQYKIIANLIHPNDIIRKPFDLGVFESVIKKYVDTGK